MVRGDLALGIAAEHQEVKGLRLCVESAQQLFPELNAWCVEIGDGIAAYCGPDSPLNQTSGVGLIGAAGKAQVDAIVRFYNQRNATAVVSVPPFADPDFVRALVAAGFTPREYHNMLIAEVAELDGERDERIGEARDREAWAQASAIGFLGAYERDNPILRTAEILASIAGNTALEARDGDRIVATGAMSADGVWGGLFAASTIAEFRGRGWHRALMRDRIARLAESGVRYVRGGAEPLSRSERTFRACGFEAIYTQTIWHRREDT
jgi:hypothetical protein